MLPHGDTARTIIWTLSIQKNKWKFENMQELVTDSISKIKPTSPLGEWRPTLCMAWLFCFSFLSKHTAFWLPKQYMALLKSYCLLTWIYQLKWLEHGLQPGFESFESWPIKSCKSTNNICNFDALRVQRDTSLERNPVIPVQRNTSTSVS